MRQIRKRIFSGLIALAVVLSIVPVSVMAADIQDFTDVSADSWYYDYVEYVTEKEYYLGTSDTTFAPEMTMTRAMFVTALSRVAGEAGDASVSPFDDVPANTWYTAAVAWATDKAGYSTKNGPAAPAGPFLCLDQKSLRPMPSSMTTVSSGSSVTTGMNSDR